MSERSGLAVAILSSAFGGTAIVATRYLAGAVDPITLGTLRFAGGVILLLPITLATRQRWPARSDWLAVAALGLLFFAIFPILFNASLIDMTAARGALAISSVPLMTMLVGAALRIEQLTPRKSIGVLVAMGGVAVALGANLEAAPPLAWRGDLLMLLASFGMAFYNVFSRRYIARSSPLGFTSLGMTVGAICLALVAGFRGGYVSLATLSGLQWLACLYLAVVCGAFIFYLWSFALGRASPTLVAISVPVNPVTASIIGLLLLHETITLNLVIGLVMVLAGIAVASGIGVSHKLRA